MAIRTAQTPAFSQVQAALNQCQPGDTLQIGPGSATWQPTEKLIVNSNIHIVGAGMNQTNISLTTNAQIQLNTDYDADAGATTPEVRLAQMTILMDAAFASQASGAPGNSMIWVYGQSQNIRLDHIWFKNVTSGCLFTGGNNGNEFTYGVIDHCVGDISCGNGAHFWMGHGGKPGATGLPTGQTLGAGDYAWTMRGIDFWASPKQWYFEDCVWLSTFAWIGNVEPGGAMVCVRHCSATGAMGFHGNDSTGHRSQGIRSVESYNNWMGVPLTSGGRTLNECRGGAMNVFNNRFSNAGDNAKHKPLKADSFHHCNNYGDGGVYNSPDGTGAYYVNDRTSIHPITGASLQVCNVSGNGSNATNKPCVPADGISGTIFASGNNATASGYQITLTGINTQLPNIPANAFQGYVVRDPDFSTPLINSGDARLAVLEAHGANATTYGGVNSSATSRTSIHFGSSGTGRWEIRRVLRSICEVGSGIHNLITGNTSQTPVLNSPPYFQEMEYSQQWCNQHRDDLTSPWDTNARWMDNTTSGAAGATNWWNNPPTEHFCDETQDIKGLKNGLRTVGYTSYVTNPNGTETATNHAYTYPEITSFANATEKANYMRIGANNNVSDWGGVMPPHDDKVIEFLEAPAHNAGQATRAWGYVYPHPLVSGTVTTPLIVITSPSSTIFTKDVAGHTFQVTTSGQSGTPVTFALSSFSVPAGASAALPTGVSFNTSTGLFSGTATTSFLGDYVFTITASHAPDTAGTQQFTLTVNAVASPPVVSITTPVNGAIFNAGTTVTVAADATDPGGAVASVEFFDGATSLGAAVTTPPYTIDRQFAVGTHVLKARATDNTSLTTDSATVTITVQFAVPSAPNIAVITG